MISTEHELAAREFIHMLRAKTMLMGLDGALLDVGSASFPGTQTIKQADAAVKPRDPRAGKGAWPTIVCEAGVSESWTKLKADARWWLENSGGEVKAVIIISVSIPKKQVRIQKWQMRTVPNTQITRDNDGPERTRPECRGRFKTIAGVVTGEPLKLKFQNIFLRDPTTKLGEGNVVFTADDLREHASRIWDGAH